MSFEPRTRRISEPGRVVLSSWAFGCVSDTLVLCTTGESAPSDEDVEVYLRRLRTADFKHILLHSRGGHPTPTQRSRIASYWKTCGRPVPRVAILTDSMVARAVLKAMEWIMGTLQSKSFPADGLEAALHWLQADAPLILVAESIAGMRAALRMSAADRSATGAIPKEPP